MKKTRTTYRAAGWTDESSDANQPRLKLCGTQNIAPCDAPPVWKVERKRRGYTSTGYYCDAHLRDEDRTAADASPQEEGLFS